MDSNPVFGRRAGVYQAIGRATTAMIHIIIAQTVITQPQNLIFNDVINRGVWARFLSFEVTLVLTLLCLHRSQPVSDIWYSTGGLTSETIPDRIKSQTLSVQNLATVESGFKSGFNQNLTLACLLFGVIRQHSLSPTSRKGGIYVWENKLGNVTRRWNRF